MVCCKSLEKLKNHFHIIAAARQIKIAHASFLSNFQKVELGPLKRAECLKLISHLSRGFRHRIEDYETFKNHIIEQVSVLFEDPENYPDAVLAINGEIYASAAMQIAKDKGLKIPDDLSIITFTDGVI